MLLELVPHGHPVLRQQLDPFDFASDPDPVALAGDLAETMLARGGIGLSANQVLGRGGEPINKRVFVLWGHPIIAVFNPRVTDFSDETVVLDEACLSFPGLVVPVKRPRALRLRFQLPSGETVTRRFEGLTARVVQHEIDHLDGKLFFDYASRLKLDGALRRAKRLGHAYSAPALRRRPTT